MISPESKGSSSPLFRSKINLPSSSSRVAFPVVTLDPRLIETILPNKSVLRRHFSITERPPSAKNKWYSRSRFVNSDRINVSRFVEDPFTTFREVALFFKSSGNDATVQQCVLFSFDKHPKTGVIMGHD